MNPYETPTAEPTPNVDMSVVADSLIAFGVSKFYAAPLPYRLLWRYGLKITTPVFSSVLTYCLIGGTFSMVLIAPVFYFAGYRPFISTAVAAASVISYPIACGYWYQIQKAKRKLGLTTLHQFALEIQKRA